MLAAFAGMLFARYFPRFGRALGYAVWAATVIGFFLILAACIKFFGLFWGLLFGGVVTAPLAIIGWFAFGLVKIGSGVIEDERERLDEEAERGPTITKDIVGYIERHFPEADRPRARTLLEGARLKDRTTIGARLARCALVASGDTLDGLRRQVNRLRVDHDNVIQSAECSIKDGELVRIRNLEWPLDESA